MLPGADYAGIFEREIGTLAFLLGRNRDAMPHFGVDHAVMEQIAFDVDAHIRGATEQLRIMTRVVPIGFEKKQVVKILLLPFCALYMILADVFFGRSVDSITSSALLPDAFFMLMAAIVRRVHGNHFLSWLEFLKTLLPSKVRRRLGRQCYSQL